MRNGVAAVLLLLAILVPAPADAWGFAGHRLITERAIALLPPEIKPFFEHHKDEIVMRSVDPDQWRNIGWEDDPNHFLDFGAPEYGKYPFTELPRDYSAALEKFGAATLKRNGFVPWRFAEQFGVLRRALEEFKRSAPYAASNLPIFTAVAAHYIEDAHQPFHATINYDGRDTGNDGIHSRFERDLIEKFGSRLRLNPSPPVAMTGARDFAFDTLLASYQLVDPILKADSESAAGKEFYDDDYYEKFFTKVQPVLERRLSEAISAVAGMIIGAWEAAGKPTLRTTDVRPVQRVRPASR
jgi:hypothetical protein